MKKYFSFKQLDVMRIDIVLRFDFGKVGILVAIISL